jgi:catechol 2,3-dioxygenase-like lactoylglutathione lyase family enzyme
VLATAGAHLIRARPNIFLDIYRLIIYIGSRIPIINKEETMSIRKLGHYSIRTGDLEASRRFYTDVLDLKEGFRPPFKFPGIWFYLGGDEDDFGVVHIIGIDANDPQGLKDYLGDKDEAGLFGTGAVDHVAFLATDLFAMRQKLSQQGVPFKERSVPSLGLHQVFISDPSGVTIEMNYPHDEARKLGLD